MTKEQILKDQLSGMELFPNTPKEEAEIMEYAIYRSMEIWADYNNQKLQDFKDYVHKRLDDAGIEKEPKGEHSQHGCRIGDRLDIVLNTLTSKTMKAETQEEWDALDGLADFGLVSWLYEIS